MLLLKAERDGGDWATFSAVLSSSRRRAAVCLYCTRAIQNLEEWKACPIWHLQVWVQFFVTAKKYMARARSTGMAS